MLIQERHLGLHLPDDPTVPDTIVESLAALVRNHVDLDAVQQIAATACVPDLLAGDRLVAELGMNSGEVTARPSTRVAVARDAAFCFYYAE